MMTAAPSATTRSRSLKRWNWSTSSASSSRIRSLSFSMSGVSTHEIDAEVELDALAVERLVLLVHGHGLEALVALEPLHRLLERVEGRGFALQHDLVLTQLDVGGLDVGVARNALRDDAEV